MSGNDPAQHKGLLKNLALTAAKYGLAGELASEGIHIKHRGNLEIASPNSGPISLTVQNGKYIILKVKETIGYRNIKFGPEEAGKAIVASYYAWLDKKQRLKNRIISRLKGVGGKAKPRENCVDILKTHFGVKNASREMCNVIASLLTLGVYKYRVLTDRTLEASPTSMYDVPSESNGTLRSLLVAFMSLLRSSRMLYEKQDVLLHEGNNLFEEYGYLLEALKIGTHISLYFSRPFLKADWRAYVAALYNMPLTVRMVEPCSSISLFEASLLGESLWVRTGNGLVTCSPGNSLVPGIALVLKETAGTSVSIAGIDKSVLKCLSLRYPRCRNVSVVIEPDSKGLERAVFAAEAGSHGVTLAYYGGILISYALYKEGEGISVIRILPRKLKYLDIIVGDNIIRRESFKGIDVRVKPGDLRRYRRLKRHLR